MATLQGPRPVYDSLDNSRDIVMSSSVYLSVCVTARITREPREGAENAGPENA